MSTKERKLAEKENRKEEILTAALKIMGQFGVHGLNIDLVAKETRLAKGTIYLYFKSKEEILGTLTIRARSMLIKEFQKIEKKNITAIEKVKGIVKANYTFLKKWPLYYSLFSFYEAENKFTESEAMYKSSEDIAKLVAGVVNDAKAEGTINKNINAEQFTMCLYGATVGLMQLMKVRGGIIKERMSISENQLLDTFLEVIENGVRK
jgi:TetR/AcrR family transcriptional regulator